MASGVEVRGEASEEMDLSTACTASPCDRDRDDRVLVLERDLKEQQELTLQMKQMIVSLKARVDHLERQVARQNNIQQGVSQPYPHPVPYAGNSNLIAKIPNTISERRTLEDEGCETSPQSQERSISPEGGVTLQWDTALNHDQQEGQVASNRNASMMQRSPRSVPGAPRGSLPPQRHALHHQQQSQPSSSYHASEGARAGRPHSSPGKQLYARKSSAFEAVEGSRGDGEDRRRPREAFPHPGPRDSSVLLPSPGRGRGARQSTPTTSDSGSRVSSRHPTPDGAISLAASDGGVRSSKSSRHPTPTELVATAGGEHGRVVAQAAAPPAGKEQKGAVRRTINGKNVVLYQPTGVATYDGPDVADRRSHKMPNARVQLEYVYGFRGKDTRSGLSVNRDGHVVFFASAVGVVLDPARNTQRFFFGHDDEVRCMAMHPDGVTVATGQQSSGAGQQLVCVWDSATCWQRATLHVAAGEGAGGNGKGAVASALAFSASGRWLAGVYEQSGSCQHELVLWEWQHGKQLACVPAHAQHPVLCLAFNPDNDGQLVTAGKAHLKFWSIAERRGGGEGKGGPSDGGGAGGGSLLTLRSKAGIFGTGTGTSQKPGFISCVAFGRGGNLLCGTSAGQILLWNETSVLQAMAAHKGAVLSLVVCRVSGQILSGGADGAVKQWTEFQEAAGADVVVNGSVRALGFGSDGGLFVGTSLCEILRVGLEEGGTVGRVLQAHANAVGGVACHPDKDWCVSVGADGSLLRWNISRRELEGQAKVGAGPGGGGGAACVALSGEGKLVAIGTSEGGVLLLHAESLRELWREENGRSAGITDVKFAPGGRLLAVAGADSFVDIFDVRQLSALGESEAVAVRRCGRCRGHCVGVLKVDWSVRGGTAARMEGGEEGKEGGGEDGKEAIEGKDAGEKSEGEEAGRGGGAGAGGGGGAAVGDGKGWYLRSCGKDHGLFFWWVNEAGLPRLLTRGGAECRDAAWATQTCVVGWGVQGMFADGKQGVDVVAVARSRDGRLLAVGDAGRRLVLTGYPCLSRPPAGKTGRGHAGVVQCVDFSGRDERVLTAGGRDMTVMQWRVDRGREGREGDGSKEGAEREEGRKVEEEREEAADVGPSRSREGEERAEDEAHGGWRVGRGDEDGGDRAGEGEHAGGGERGPGGQGEREAEDGEKGEDAAEAAVRGEMQGEGAVEGGMCCGAEEAASRGGGKGGTGGETSGEGLEPGLTEKPSEPAERVSGLGLGLGLGLEHGGHVAAARPTEHTGIAEEMEVVRVELASVTR